MLTSIWKNVDNVYKECRIKKQRKNKTEKKEKKKKRTEKKKGKKWRRKKNRNKKEKNGENHLHFLQLGRVPLGNTNCALARWLGRLLSVAASSVRSLAGTLFLSFFSVERKFGPAHYRNVRREGTTNSRLRRQIAVAIK